MRRSRCPILVLTLSLALSSLAAVPPAKQALRFGVRVDPGAWPEARRVLAEHPATPENPLGLCLSIPSGWAKSPDWTELDETVRAAVEAHAALSVCTAIPGVPGKPGVSAYLATLSDHVTGKASILGLSLNRDQFPAVLQRDPDKLALVLKEMTVALRGRSKATVLIGNVEPEDLPLMTPLYAREFRAYVEGYCSRATGPTGEPSEEVVRYLESYHLGAPLLLHLPRMKSPIGAQLLVLLAASRSVTFTDIEPVDVEATWTALLSLRARLSPGMAPGYATQATSIEDGEGPRPDVGIINLLDAGTMVQGMALVPTVSGSKAATLKIHLPTGDVTNPVVYPLPLGEKVDLGYTADQKKQETVLKVPWTGRALLLFFNRLQTGTVGMEEVSVSTAYTIPVEVILARHQALQRPQDIFLDNYRRKAEVDYHFKIPGGTGSLDVTFKNTFFFEKGLGARWVQNELLLNGVAWKGKKIPELPVIEPEKVNTLPLALTLGRDYTYKRLRDDALSGHDCFVVEFIPAPGAKGSLYSGKVWIDKSTYAKIRMRVKQTGLQEPMVSNEETDEFAPFPSPDGKTFWLLSKVRGQQIFSVGGRNVTAERVITFGPPVVNDTNFRDVVAEAEASDKPILQETEKGLRYLVKQKDGTRKLRMDPKSSRLVAAGGIYYDKSLDFPLPIAGVNYFDYDWRKTGTQVNLLVGGAVNTLTAAKVNLFPKVDGSLNAALFAVPFQDRIYPGGEEDESLRIKTLREVAAGSLGWRFNQLSKLSLDLNATYYRFSRVKQTSPLFRLPEDHVDLGAGLTYDFSWRGWSLSASYEGHKRTSWKPWGLAGLNEEADRYKKYRLWEASFSKSFYLPYFQKIASKVTWMDGRDLDRFSRYQFTYLGKHALAGYAGSGIRFDRGGIASVAYQFNVANVLRFGLRADYARVQVTRDEGPWQDHAGVGMNVGITGPWQTYWTLDAGYAVKSDVAAVEHDYTTALLVIKLW